MRRYPVKKIVILLVVLAVGYGLWKWLGPDGADENAQGQTAGVDASQAIATTATLWNEFSGRLEAPGSVEVRPQVAGTIQSVHFEDGAYVTKGQKLFTIDPRPFRAGLAQAQGRLAAAQAAVQNARADAARARKLVGAKAISARENEQRQAAMNVAMGEVDAAKAAVETAALSVEYSNVVAPISGKVGRAEITEGNLVEAGGAVLARIVAIDPIYAGFEVDEATFLRTLQGLTEAQLKKVPVEVGLASEEGTPHEGSIQSFDNQLGMTSGTLRVRASLPNPDRTLLPGLFARVRIGTPEPMPVVLVNDSAIGTDQTKKFVMAVVDGKAAYMPVTPGPMVDGLRAVEGLKGGETVIVKGLMRARPDTPVNPRMVDMRTLEPVGAPAVGEAVKDSAEGTTE